MSNRVVYLCDVCGFPVGDGEGYFQVDQSAAARRAREVHAAERGAAPGDFLAMVALEEASAMARWQVLHTRCDPNPDDHRYAVTVDRARTSAQLLEWTLHLQGKAWYASTDWTTFVRRLAPPAN